MVCLSEVRSLIACFGTFVTAQAQSDLGKYDARMVEDAASKAAFGDVVLSGEVVAETLKVFVCVVHSVLGIFRSTP